MTLWGGRVEKGLAPEVADFLRAPDRELLPYDCAASKVHAAAARRGRAPVRSGAGRGGGRRSTGSRPKEASTDADEDVHSAIERLLGDLGRKIHAGRSRNDQVAAAMRLYVQDACDEARAGLRRLALAILDRAERGGGRRSCPATPTCSAASR